MSTRALVTLFAVPLLVLAGCSREKGDWRSAQAADSPESYEQFIAEHPDSSLVATARDRLHNFANASGAAAAADAAAAASPAGEGAALPDAAVTTPPASGGYGVQLGAFSSAERANEEWKKLQTDAAGLLDGLSPRVVVGEAQGKAIYRLQAEVRDEVQARAVCGGLKVAKKPCVPVIPHP